MSMQDPIADMLTRIRNGQSSRKITIDMSYSKLKLAISKVLKEEGYIKDYKVVKDSKIALEISLKYFKGKPVLEKIDRVSKPSLRIYRKKNDLPKVMDGMGIAVISTSKGVMTDDMARHMGLGGEIICYIA
ncbi:30S ribosomal protein S8 [Candidatus Pantoea edessiphila]|uniref:Small ribosomal subunit protein uS8 n=1 Tax=Candidatus Pantoea edessiphila TaxID=2044610 RepID=A0A2P5SXW9_9GAMM|nr:30S ribosomal protein S8 [Candidatus Pantoea edessiphila]MBK4775920.1 30S ribosomal protein S8 [Pantoea sp. Edef]PPI87188.1 30S ribosomal protein S8 [Candidatus Pantoea edessiphila]